MRHSTTTLFLVAAAFGLWIAACAPELIILPDQADGETQLDGADPDASSADAAQDDDGSSVEADASTTEDIDGSSAEDADQSEETIEPGQACDNSSECPAEPCVPGSCVSGFCEQQALPEGAACDDGEACTKTDICTAGTCQGTAFVCEDGDPCTADSCADDACVYAPLCCEEASDCDDLDGCNGAETCVANACQAGTPLDCGDSDDCTLDACNLGGCVHTAAPGCCTQSSECDDGDGCNGIETCANSTCQSGVAMVCDDGQACNGEETCGNSQCTPGPPLPCAAGSACTGLGFCENGQCLLGPPLNCNDGNTCTTDSCQAGSCQHQPVPGCCNTNGQCSDGDTCNGEEQCVGQQCVAGPPFNCDDGNPCTDESCEDGLCVGPSTPYECLCSHDEASECATLPIHRFLKQYAESDIDHMFSPSPNGGLTGYDWQGPYFELFQTKGMANWLPLYQSFAGPPVSDHLQSFVEANGLFGYDGDVLLGYCSPTQEDWAPHKLTAYWSAAVSDHSLFAPDHTNEQVFVAVLEYTAAESCWVPWVCTGDCDQ
ncbi:MAG: hypothetical protein ACI9WU_004859 [Myxococcota bacterium]